LIRGVALHWTKYLTHSIIGRRVRRPEKRRGQRKEGAREKERPEKRRGQRKEGAREKKALGIPFEILQS
jgi:hypothetical protein